MSDLIDENVFRSSINTWKERLEEIVEEERYGPQERPAEVYGADALFISGFINDEMSAIFPCAVDVFLKNEEMLKDPEQRYIFEGCVLPLRKERRLSDPYHFLVLSMMLRAAKKGSIYSRNLILTLYRQCYKKEYNVLKRMKKLRFIDYIESFSSEEEEEGEDLLRCARIFTIAELMEMELDGYWYGLSADLNDDYCREAELWKTIIYGGWTDLVKAHRDEDFREALRFIEEEYPELNGIRFGGIKNRDPLVKKFPDYQVLTAVQDMIEHGCDLHNSDSEMLFEKGKTSVKEWAARAASLTGERWKSRENLPVLLALAGVLFISERFSALAEIRREELKQTLGAGVDEIVSDEDLKEFFEEEDSESAEEYLCVVNEVLRTKDNRRRESEKLHNAILASAPSLRNPVVRRRKEEIQIEEILRKLEKAAEENPEEILERQQALIQKNEKIERELSIQRGIYEEVKEQNRRLKKELAQLKNEHEELLALRDLFYGLETDEETFDEKSKTIDEMAEVLRKHAVTIIGGHENWVKKMRRLLPEWTYIAAGGGISSLEGPIASSERVYFYTDIMSHSMYNKFLKSAADHNTPYSFLHGTNIEKTLGTIYNELCRK